MQITSPGAIVVHNKAMVRTLGPFSIKLCCTISEYQKIGRTSLVKDGAGSKISILLNFFLLLLLSQSCVTPKLYSVCEYHTCRMTALLLGNLSFLV